MLGHPNFNGIDFLEVQDDPALPTSQRQRTLFVHFLKPLAPGSLKPENVRIEGGERIRDIAVTGATIGTGADANLLTVTVNAPGDFSIYTLRLVRGVDDPQPPDGLDPLSSAVDFSFKVECETDFDCKPERVCAPEVPEEPEINFLAKDYASFRQLMLDRLSVLMPDWQEKHPADLGLTLIELLAYVADQLSYQQDVIATEAYLGTARRRVSVRRHARLVDYAMHDGCNARAWVQVQSSADNVQAPKGTQLLTSLPGFPKRFASNSETYTRALAQAPIVLETMQAATLFQAHNQMLFYTWGAQECCLPKGATRATLSGKLEDLKPGAVLILKEVLGPETGEEGDADPAHRHPVRLTKVELKQDPLGGRFLDPPNDSAVDVTEIEWSNDDALPFPVCISAKLGDKQIPNVSVALGNLVLADHGFSIKGEALGAVPAPSLFLAPAGSGDRCEPSASVAIPPRFRPFLKNTPLTFAPPYDAAASASAALETSPAEALPALQLKGVLDGQALDWQPVRDLLNSAKDKPEFVVEVEDDGTAYLRFGDNERGLRPDPGTSFTADYRVGNGAAGNVGPEALTHIVSSDSGIIGVLNPMAARGGTEPESIEAVRQRAPFAFRTQERAVTADDYARVTERNPQVQRAAATFRWTGSWRTVFVTVDRLGGAPADAPFRANLQTFLDRYRMAGQDTAVDNPRFISLEIEMLVCVKPDYFRSEVERALLDVFSNRLLPDGTRGVFQPDNFTFGQPVFLSRLYAAAQAVAGVNSVQITKFQRQGTPSTEALDSGRLEVNRLEIARLDNDPDFPERGVFRLTLDGGK